MTKPIHDVAAWHGTYLDEDQLVADVLARVQADPEGAKRWRDPASWQMPIMADGHIDPAAPEHAGCLMFAGMSIRNHYGLWHPQNPYTLGDGADLQVTDGVINDPRHPDNFSGRVIDRVRAALAT